MFLIDVSPSMGKLREVEVPLSNGDVQIVEMTNIEWALQYVKLKVQEMVRKICPLKTITLKRCRSTMAARQTSAASSYLAPKVTLTTFIKRKYTANSCHRNEELCA